MKARAVPVTAFVAVGTVALWAVTLAGSLWILASQPTQTGGATVALPTFDTARRADAQPDEPAPRTTLLPGDCSEVLAGQVDVAALLAAPIGSYTEQSVVGVGSPSVGMLEQLSCTYQRIGQSTRQESAPLAIRLAAFSDPAAAASQRNRNLAAEADDSISARPVAVGDAHATLLAQRHGYLMLLAYDRYTVSLNLARGIVPEQSVESILIDLARRIWPNLAPAPVPPPKGDATPAVNGHPTAHGRRS